VYSIFNPAFLTVSQTTFIVNNTTKSNSNKSIQRVQTSANPKPITLTKCNKNLTCSC